MKLALLVSLAFIGSSFTSASPVERIVNLLEELKAKTTQEGKVEEQIYNKYACWCEKTSKRKADDIVDGQEEMRSLGQTILKLKGKIATLTAEIEKLSADIKANEEEQEKLTSVRSKENAAWQAESEETKQALAALQEAIKVLTKATTGKTGLLQIRQQVTMNAVRNVINKMPSNAALPAKHLNLLSEFLTAKDGYAPQSATIQGILSDMYTTFSKDLQTATNDEATANHDYEDLMAKIETENNEFKSTRARKQNQKAEAEDRLADTTKAYDDTEKQLKADTEFFDATKTACEDKHKEWTERSGLREAELEGINKALELLSSDEARELFAKSIKPGVETFLQIGSTPALLQDSAAAPIAKAYNALKAEVKKSHSIRLAALAVEVRTAKVGHFDEVIKAIDEMIKTLQEEGAADLAKKTQCLNEYQKIDLAVQDLDWKIKNNVAEIAKYEKLIALRQNQKAKAVKKKEETEQYIKDITADRHAEHDAYETAKKDDQDAVALLEQAKVTFSEYYKKNDIKMGPIQGSVKGVLLQEEPEFAVSADQAPDATFSHKGNNKLQGKDIISLFDYIIEDLNDELANEKKIEEKAQEDYEAEMATAQKLVDELVAKITNLEDIIAKRKSDKEAESKDMQENNEDRTAELDYEEKIKPDCNWILKAFTQRADARAAEMNGLSAAKDFLAGYQQSQSALLEKSKKFDDQKFGNIGFLGISH
jgi:predicted  nucleic acid-binding Zn-ribbon protein